MKKISNIKDKKRGSSGFTLVELLATIAVLSLVITIVIYAALNIVNKTKEESYKVTISNIEKEAGNYVIEHSDLVSWRISELNDNEYNCITVQHLIDKGYFNGDVLESNVSKDTKVNANNYIYLEREKDTMAVSKKILLYDDLDNSLINGLCANIVADGSISFDVKPSGFAKSKEVTIRYEIFNNVDKVSNYLYSYSFDNDENIKKENVKFNNHVVEEIISVNENGIVNASIKDIVSSTKIIDGIDNIKPNITTSYDGDETVRKSVVIPINVTDLESGINNDIILDEEDLVVKIGDNVITDIILEKENNNYNLTINDLSNKGDVVITVKEDSVFDNVLNGNIETVLKPDVSFSNEYTISYDSNGGTGTMDDIICVYGKTCTLSNNSFTRTGYTFNGWNTKSDGSGTSYAKGYKFTSYNNTSDLILYAQWEENTYLVKYNSNGGTGTMSDTSCAYGSICTLRSNGFTRTGYTFTGWNTAADGSGTSYANGYEFASYDKKSDLTLYAQWRINKVIVKYNVNGGTVKSSTTTESGTTYSWTADSSGIVSRNGIVFVNTINYGSKTDSDGLANWDNSKYLKITRLGYTGKSGSEWKCLSGCTTSEKTFADNVAYSASDFCDASSEDCTVVVGVNWATVTRYITATSGLNCRTGPGTSYSKKTAYSCGKSLSGYYVDSNSDWFYYIDGGCYVSATYISSTKKSCSSSSGGSGGSSGGGSSSTPIVGTKGACDSCTADSQCMEGMVCQASGCVDASGNYYRCCGYRGSGGHTVMRCLD